MAEDKIHAYPPVKGILFHPKKSELNAMHNQIRSICSN